MIASQLPPRGRRRARRRGLALLRFALRLLLVASVFAGGVALGEALHDNPSPGSSVTGVRTLKPLPLPPVKRTVTVTRSG